MQWTFDRLLRAVMCHFRALLRSFLTQIELITDPLLLRRGEVAMLEQRQQERTLK